MSARRAPDACAVVVAGGRGERFGDARGKQFVPLCGRPMAAWSLIALDAAPSVGAVVVVCAADRVAEMREAVVGPLGLSVPVSFAPAGGVRQESCLSGLRAAASTGLPLVAIHDAARPLVTPEGVERVLARVRDDASLDGAICAHPAVDTLKLVAAPGDGAPGAAGEGAAGSPLIASTPDRSRYWYAETPQAFWLDRILDAHERAAAEGHVGTDDASLVERLGGRVALVDPGCDNLKVTLPEDLAVAEAVMARRPGSSRR